MVEAEAVPAIAEPRELAPLRIRRPPEVRPALPEQLLELLCAREGGPGLVGMVASGIEVTDQESALGTGLRGELQQELEDGVLGLV